MKETGVDEDGRQRMAARGGGKQKDDDLERSVD